ncbi:hypothetical protein CCMA1212_002220 [Trichoderma ghanense]|uniref:Uncharacterized protein n=1 Tax=Trichoderma ghanense TaxID=65468 RepID=A0ABY2HEX6_9HYPO
MPRVVFDPPFRQFYAKMSLSHPVCSVLAIDVNRYSQPQRSGSASPAASSSAARGLLCNGIRYGRDWNRGRRRGNLYTGAGHAAGTEAVPGRGTQIPHASVMNAASVDAVPAGLRYLLRHGGVVPKYRAGQPTSLQPPYSPPLPPVA